MNFILNIKLAERVQKYTKTEVFVGALHKQLEKNIRSPFYKHHSELPSEDCKVGLIEMVMDQKKVTDDKLVHVGVAILQESKLLFLRFVQFLRTFLVPGSYQPIYCGKIYYYYFLNFSYFLFKTPTRCVSGYQSRKSLMTLSRA